MPLPISSQTYIHNPLVGVQAAQSGASVGSPFSNFVEGIFSGAEKGVKIQQGLQELELAPREQARKERATTIDEQRAALEQVREDRLANQQDFEQSFKTEELNIKRDESKNKQDLTSARIRNLQAKTALASQKQAESNIIDGALNDLIIDGSSDSLDAILANSQGRTRGKLLEKIITDRERGPAVANRIEDVLAEGRVNGETASRLSSFLRSLETGRDISTSREIAEAGAPILLGTIGARPREGAKVNMRKMKDGGFEVIEIPKNGNRVQLGVIPAETDPKTMQAVFPAIAAHNRMVDIQRELAKSVSQVATAQVQQKQLQPQQELPTKISQRTAAERTGLANAKVGASATLPKTPAQTRQSEEAKRRIKEMVNPATRTEKTKRQEEAIRSSFINLSPFTGP